MGGPEYRFYRGGELMFREQEEVSRRKSRRMTRQRRVILEVLREHRGRHLTAEEIYCLVKPLLTSISLGTVYRNLQLLTEEGIVARTMAFDGRARFEMGERELAHHHFICLECGSIMDVPCYSLSCEMQAFAANHNLRVASHFFEMHGYCAACNRLPQGLSGRED